MAESSRIRKGTQNSVARPLPPLQIPTRCARNLSECWEKRLVKNRRNKQDFYLVWSLLGYICIATMSDSLFMSINCGDPPPPPLAQTFANTDSQVPKIRHLSCCFKQFLFKRSSAE